MKPFPIILADAITTTTTGPVCGIRGERIAQGTATQKTRCDIPVEVNVRATGAGGSTATVLVRVSVDNSTWVTWATLGCTIPASGAPVDLQRVGRISSAYDYVYLSVTAVSGATIDGYIRRMG